MIDTTRSEPLYNPASFQKQSIGLIGAGAVGSKIALDLACLGVRNVSVYDDDVVEPHNLSNQAYIGQQIGAFKVVALNHLISNKAQVDDASKLGWQFVNKKFVTLTRHPHHVLISAVDTRSGREELLLNGLSNACSLVVDCRMDAMQGSVMMYDPRNPAHRTNYMEHLPSEDYEGEVSACGLPVNCGSTSEFVSATAISLLLNWWESQIMENIHFNLRAMDFWRTPIAQQEAIS